MYEIVLCSNGWCLHFFATSIHFWHYSILVSVWNCSMFKWLMVSFLLVLTNTWCKPKYSEIDTGPEERKKSIVEKRYAWSHSNPKRYGINNIIDTKCIVRYPNQKVRKIPQLDNYLYWLCLNNEQIYNIHVNCAKSDLFSADSFAKLHLVVSANS